VICLMALLGNQIQDLVTHVHPNRPFSSAGNDVTNSRPRGDRSRNLTSISRSVEVSPAMMDGSGPTSGVIPTDISPDGWPAYVRQKSSTDRSRCVR